MIGQITSEADNKADIRPSLLDGAVFNTYRTLLRRLQWPHEFVGQQDRASSGAAPALCCLGITSSRRREGVSTVAWQIAAAAAELDEGSTLLVDANPYRPTVHRTFGVRQTPGLIDSLLNPALLEESVRPLDGQNLSILPVGGDLSEDLKAFGGAAVSEVLELLRPHYSLIVFDMPPTDERNIGLRVAEMMDGVLIVVEAERASFETARRARQILQRSGVNLLGAVLNKDRNQGWAR